MALALDLNGSKLDALRLVGTFSVAAGICAAPLVFALALPWNTFGLHPQTDTVVIAMHLLSAAIALGLCVLSARNDLRASAAMINAPVMILVSLGVYSAAVSYFAFDPWLSVNGPGGDGIGALWHFDAAVLLAGYRYAFQTRLRRPLSYILCAAGVATLCSPALPASFALDRPFAIGIAALSLAACILAQRAAERTQQDSAAERRARLTVVVAVTLVASLMAWSAAPSVKASGTTSEDPASHAPNMSADFEDGPAGWLWSRSQDLRLAVSAAASAPMRLVVGHGFGSFAEIHAQRAQEIPDLISPTIEESTSTDMSGHEVVEVRSTTGNYLLSAGIVGLFLYLAFLCSLTATRGGTAAAALLGATGALAVVPLIATPALMVVIAWTVPSRETSAGSRVAGGLLFAGLSAALFFAATVQAGFSRVLDEETRFGFLLPVINMRTCAGVEARFASSRMANITLYDRLTELVSHSPDPGALAISKAANIGTLSCVMRRLANEHNDTLALITSLENRGALLAATQAARSSLRPDVERWDSDLDEALLRAPRRTDLAVPYIEHLVSTDRQRAFVEADRLGSTMPQNDPVREYLFSVRDAMKDNLMAPTRKP